MTLAIMCDLEFNLPFITQLKFKLKQHSVASNISKMFVYKFSLNPSFNFKKQSPRKNIKQEFFNLYFRFPKWAKWFFTSSKKTSFFRFSLFLALKKSKKPLAQAPKTFQKISCCLFWVTIKSFTGPVSS